MAPRVALVTGGSRGVGRALAAGLVAGGWRVVIDARATPLRSAKRSRCSARAPRRSGLRARSAPFPGTWRMPGTANGWPAWWAAGADSTCWWGAYGSAKAALDQLSRVLAQEEPGVRVYVLDPGDMATEMHRAAVPGADLGLLPRPESVVPVLLRLIDGDLPSGRYRAAELATSGAMA